MNFVLQLWLSALGLVFQLRHDYYIPLEKGRYEFSNFLVSSFMRSCVEAICRFVHDACFATTFWYGRLVSVSDEMMKWVCAKFGEDTISDIFVSPNQLNGDFGNILATYMLFYQKGGFSHHFEYICSLLCKWWHSI